MSYNEQQRQGHRSRKGRSGCKWVVDVPCFLATKNHKSHKTGDLLGLVPFRG